jgi:hypothetical protein
VEDRYEDQISRLVQEVRAAFSDVPYPGDDRITGSCYPWDEGVSDYFRGKGQDGHRVEVLREHVAALSFFLPEAYHYYLPAFVIAELEDPETADIICDSIFYDFSHDKADSLIARLTPAQRQAMFHYFEYYRNTYNHSNEEALDRLLGKLADGSGGE